MQCSWVQELGFHTTLELRASTTGTFVATLELFTLQCNVQGRDGHLYLLKKDVLVCSDSVYVTVLLSADVHRTSPHPCYAPSCVAARHDKSHLGFTMSFS